MLPGFSTRQLRQRLPPPVPRDAEPREGLGIPHHVGVWHTRRTISHASRSVWKLLISEVYYCSPMKAMYNLVHAAECCNCARPRAYQPINVSKQHINR